MYFLGLDDFCFFVSYKNDHVKFVSINIFKISNLIILLILKVKEAIGTCAINNDVTYFRT